MLSLSIKVLNAKKPLVCTTISHITHALSYAAKLGFTEREMDYFYGQIGNHDPSIDFELTMVADCYGKVEIVSNVMEEAIGDNSNHDLYRVLSVLTPGINHTTESISDLIDLVSLVGPALPQFWCERTGLSKDLKTFSLLNQTVKQLNAIPLMPKSKTSHPTSAAAGRWYIKHWNEGVKLTADLRAGELTKVTTIHILRDWLNQDSDHGTILRKIVGIESSGEPLQWLIVMALKKSGVDLDELLFETFKYLQGGDVSESHFYDKLAKV